MQASCRRCAIVLRRAARLLDPDSGFCIDGCSSCSLGAAFACHLNLRLHATRSQPQLTDQSSENWEGYVQSLKLPQDAGENGGKAAGKDALLEADTSSQCEEPASAATDGFLSSQNLSSLPSPPTRSASTAMEGGISEAAASEILPIPSRINRESAAFSAPVFPGEENIQNLTAMGHSGVHQSEPVINPSVNHALLSRLLSLCSCISATKVNLSTHCAYSHSLACSIVHTYPPKAQIRSRMQDTAWRSGSLTARW
jgi:hypothetical protein